MGLNEGDQEKVPTSLTARDCYDRVWTWHRTNGEQEAQKRELSPNYRDQYLAILAELPTDTDATDEDIAFLFHEVIAGTFEWAYHDEDSHGIKMAAYAFYAVDTFYGGDLSAVADAASRSELSRLKG